MSVHRLRDVLSSDRDSSPVPASSVCGFVVCPLVSGQHGMMAQMMMLQVYQLAYEQARAVSRPSRLERLEAFSSN
jgi:hypothetical protein